MKKIIYTHVLYLLLIEVTCRKYDLESEAMKLHGEDFDTVLKRFRKTSDYLIILEDKPVHEAVFAREERMQELIEHKDDIKIMTMHHYIEQLKKKITDIIGINRGRTESSTPTLDAATSYLRGHFRYRRQEHTESDESLTPVQQLDSYPRLSSPLSVAERNSFVDLGFEYAGHIIHAMIKSLGPEDGPAKSTLLPYGGDHYHHHKLTTTTEHVHVHEVKPTDGATDTTVGIESTTSPIFKYRYKPQRPQ